MHDFFTDKKENTKTEYNLQHADRNLQLARLLLLSLREWGICHFAVSPGARNAPLFLALKQLQSEMQSQTQNGGKIHSYSPYVSASNRKAFSSITHFDERGAAFHALGFNKVQMTCGYKAEDSDPSHRLAAVITTSGSAVANLFPAVVEAASSEVPLVLITADRPKELISVRANQAIVQKKIFYKYSAISKTLCTASEKKNIPSKKLVKQVYKAMRRLHAGKGVIHLNVPFREPLFSSSIIAKQQKYPEKATKTANTEKVVLKMHNHESKTKRQQRFRSTLALLWHFKKLIKITSLNSKRNTARASKAARNLYRHLHPSFHQPQKDKLPSPLPVFIVGNAKQSDEAKLVSLFDQLCNHGQTPLVYASTLSGLRNIRNKLEASSKSSVDNMQNKKWQPLTTDAFCDLLEAGSLQFPIIHFGGELHEKTVLQALVYASKLKRRNQRNYESKNAHDHKKTVDLENRKGKNRWRYLHIEDRRQRYNPGGFVTKRIRAGIEETLQIWQKLELKKLQKTVKTPIVSQKSQAFLRKQTPPPTKQNLLLGKTNKLGEMVFFKELIAHSCALQQLGNAPQQTLYLGNSMPIRSFDRATQFFCSTSNSFNRHGFNLVLASRGASGIDGLIATVAGIAAANTTPRFNHTPTTTAHSTRLSKHTIFAVIGDLSALHDASSFFLLHRLKTVLAPGVRIKLFIVNNREGNIFRHLQFFFHIKPYAEDFLYKHNFGFQQLASATKLNYRRVSSLAMLKRMFSQEYVLEKKTSHPPTQKSVRKTPSTLENVSITELVVDSEENRRQFAQANPKFC